MYITAMEDKESLKKLDVMPDPRQISIPKGGNEIIESKDSLEYEWSSR